VARQRGTQAVPGILAYYLSNQECITPASGREKKDRKQIITREVPNIMTQTVSMQDALNRLTVYVVNLDRRPDRWKMVSDMLKQAQFHNVQRVSAVDGSQITAEQIRHLVTPDVYRSLGQLRTNHEDIGSLGAIGCFLSHYKIWAQVAETNQPALIMEDDAVLTPDWRACTVTSLRPYDVVLLGYDERHDMNGTTDNEEHDMTNSPAVVPFRGWFFGTHCYYLSPQGARRFMTRAFPMQQQVDSYMAQVFIRDQTIKSAKHRPVLAEQSDIFTDVQTLMHPVIHIKILLRLCQRRPVAWVLMIHVLLLLFLLVLVPIRLVQTMF
jgi:glycosyl transferase family 25